MDRVVTIYMDEVTFEDDDGVIRATVTDRGGKSVEIIGCVPRFVAALNGAERFWSEFQTKRARELAEATIAALPPGPKRKRG